MKTRSNGELVDISLLRGGCNRSVKDCDLVREYENGEYIGISYQEGTIGKVNKASFSAVEEAQSRLHLFVQVVVRSE